MSALAPSVAVATREPLFWPDAEQVATTQLSAFMRFCESRAGQRFPVYQDFDAWSVRESSSFWTLLLEWSGLRHEGSLAPAMTGSCCEHAAFFPNLRISYAENLLSMAGEAGSRPAISSVHADGSVRRWTLQELCAQVGAFSAGLKASGLQPGQPVALIARNGAAAVVAALSAAALGCPLATVAPELGDEALLGRLTQVEPALLMADLSSGATAGRRPALLEQIIRALPTVRGVVLLEDTLAAPPLPCPVLSAPQLIAAHANHAEPQFVRLPFNHPLFILFTSGTTGVPKCLLHGAGGTLLEHVKEHRLHCNLCAQDKLFFHTSIGWMMWHWQLSALASGAELVLYDGPVSSAESLWRIVARERVTVFGTSPAYLQLCERSDAHALDGMDFEALRAVLSTGSVLHPADQTWVSEHIKPLPVQSISGGSDIIGCFVLGNPNLPAYSAESQCRSLGLDVRSLPDPRAPAAAIGELVCANPFPSRPLGFLHDSSGTRFHAAYFAQHEGYWTHGDLIEFTPEGTALIHGRSDGIMNVRGIRIGPAEIYRILRHLPEVCEAMAVEQIAPEEVGGSRMVLLVVLQPRRALHDALIRRIRHELQTRASAAHVPDVILQVAELPQTYSGKRSEASARNALNGIAPANAHALRNPSSLQPLLDLARERRARNGKPPHALTLEDMTHIWEQALGIEGLRPEDNFFDLGGESLTALRLVREVQQRTGGELPLSLLYAAPTIAGLLQAVTATGASMAAGSLRLLKAGRLGVPLFLVPGIGGSVMELQPLARALRIAAPVYGLEARGFRSEEAPYERIQDMARAYIDELHALYPQRPYHILGYSFGGLVAYEMGQMLTAAGEQPALIAVLDTTPHERFWTADARREYLLRRGRRALRRLRRTPVGGWNELAREAVRELRVLRPQSPPPRMRSMTGGRSVRADHTGTPLGGAQALELPPAVLRVREAAFSAFDAYQPRPCRFPLTLLRSDLRLSDRCDPQRIWAPLAPALTIRNLPGDHYSIIRTPGLSALAAVLDELLLAEAAEKQKAPELV